MRKKISTLMVYFVLLSPFIGKSQDNPFVGQGPNTTDLGKVYFIREPKTTLPVEKLLQRSLNYFKVFIDSRLVCSLSEQRYSVHDVPAGRHIIRVYARATNPKRYSHEKIIQIQAGKSYYIALDFRGYNAPTPVVIHPLDEDLAQMILPSMKQDKGCMGKE
jgi:hypothetical protein